MTSQGYIQVRDVDMSYQRGRDRVVIFNQLRLDIPSNDFLAVMGPSGSGKTTLLNLLGGLTKPVSGDVVVGTDIISKFRQRQLTQWRAAKVGFISQFYNLMPVLSAAENVELPLLIKNLGRAKRRENVATALAIVGLDDRAQHRPKELSGGQQQRVAIARAIVSDPDIILADEPTGDLDRASAEEILQLLRTLNEHLGKLIVMVTHDPVAARFAKRTLHLDKGTFLSRADLAA